MPLFGISLMFETDLDVSHTYLEVLCNDRLLDEHLTSSITIDLGLKTVKGDVYLSNHGLVLQEWMPSCPHGHSQPCLAY